MISLETKDIGGGIVRRIFNSGDRQYRAGDTLTADQIQSWPHGNRRALIENRFIEVYPAHPGAETTVAPPKRGRPPLHPLTPQNQ